MKNLDQIDSFYSAHGYIRMSEALPGEDAEYLEFHKGGVRAIEDRMASNARNYGVRGRSKRAMVMLHSDLPNPVWGVEVSNV